MLNDQKRDLLLNVFYGDPPITSIKRIYEKHTLCISKISSNYRHIILLHK